MKIRRTEHIYTTATSIFIYAQFPFFFNFPINVTLSFDANNDIVDEVTRLLNKATNQGCSNIFFSTIHIFSSLSRKITCG